MKMNITYSIRKLIQDKDIQWMVSGLYKNMRSEEAVFVSLPLANKRFNKIADDPDHEGAEKLNELCFNLEDSMLLNELLELKIISISREGMGDDDDFAVYVKINNPEFIEELHEWVKDSALILNYGIFSLHTFTGEAYCLDNKCVFHTGKGLFRVFKAFLKGQTHILDYTTIYMMFHEGNNRRQLGPLPFEIHQIVGDIREKLGMKGKLSKLLISSSNQYLLKPGLSY